uniref:Uncharacterized protein n=1 Tax=Varanus komodoensis TaxID=61221 RepID=A0A8D2LVA9_VARKO
MLGSLAGAKGRLPRFSAKPLPGGASKPGLDEVKARAVDEMIARIKSGVALRPVGSKVGAFSRQVGGRGTATAVSLGSETPLKPSWRG